MYGYLVILSAFWPLSKENVKDLSTAFVLRLWLDLNTAANLRAFAHSITAKAIQFNGWKCDSLNK